MELDSEIQISKKIKLIRELKGITQESLAEKLNLSKRAYVELENGRTHITIEKLKKLSKVLEVDPSFLLDSQSNVIFQNCTQSGYFVQNYNGKDYELLSKEIENLWNQIKLKDVMLLKLTETLK